MSSQCPVDNCKDVVRLEAECNAKRAEVEGLRHDIVRIYDKIDANTRWLIGLLFSVGIETLTLIIAIIQITNNK